MWRFFDISYRIQSKMVTYSTYYYLPKYLGLHLEIHKQYIFLLNKFKFFFNLHLQVGYNSAALHNFELMHHNQHS